MGSPNTTSNLTVGCAGGAAKGGVYGYPFLRVRLGYLKLQHPEVEVRREVGRAAFCALIVGIRVVTIAKGNWPGRQDEEMWNVYVLYTLQRFQSN